MFSATHTLCLIDVGLGIIPASTRMPAVLRCVEPRLTNEEGNMNSRTAVSTIVTFETTFDLYVRRLLNAG